MIFRNLTPDGDWELGKGQQSFSGDLQALMLNLKTRILSWVGDCFFDLDAGIDWKNLLDYGQDITLKSAIKNIVFRTPGILKVSDISLIKSSRNALISFNVDTIFGSNVQNEINLAVGG